MNSMSKQRKHQVKYASVEFEYEHGEFLVEITPPEFNGEAVDIPEVVMRKDGGFFWASDGHFSQKFPTVIDAVRFSMIEKEIYGNSLADYSEAINEMKIMILGLIIREHGITDQVVNFAKKEYESTSFSDYDKSRLAASLIDSAKQSALDKDNTLFNILSEIVNCENSVVAAEREFNSLLSGFDSNKE